MNIRKAFDLEFLNCSDENYRWFGLKISKQNILKLLKTIDDDALWNFKYIFGLVSNQFSFNQEINNNYLKKIKSNFLKNSSLKWLYVLANDDNGLILEYHKEENKINEESKIRIRLRKLNKPTFEEVSIDEFFNDIQLIVYHSEKFEIRKKANRKGKIIFNDYGYKLFQECFESDNFEEIDCFKNYQKQHWVNAKDWEIIIEYIKNNKIENCMEYEL